MRYVIVDLEGASRDYFETSESAREALFEAELDAPGSAAELYVVTYDDTGTESGEPERGDELLRSASKSVAVGGGENQLVVLARTLAERPSAGANTQLPAVPA